MPNAFFKQPLETQILFVEWLLKDFKAEHVNVYNIEVYWLAQQTNFEAKHL